MAHLNLRYETTGAHYYLDGQPLTNSDSIGLKTPMTTDGWMRGRFMWNGDPGEDPWFETTGYGQRLTATNELRWVDVDPRPPHVTHRAESGAPLRDWERRGKV